MQNKGEAVNTISLGADVEKSLASDGEPQINRHAWLVLAAVGVGSLLSSIDTNVVNIALPTIGHKFNTDVASAEWVISVYLLTTCSLLLPFGRLGDLRGQKPIYIWGFFIFVASSALCGLAPNIALLIFFRALQGLGASMLLSSSPAILTLNFPAAQRGRVLGLQVLMVYLGSTIGPMLGGWLTQYFSWRAIFYINVPIGLIALYLSARFIPHRKPSKHIERFDYAGAVLFMAAFSILIFALNQGHVRGWTSSYILRMLLAAILLIAGFIWTERKAASPMLDLSMFRSPQFSLSTVASVCNYLAMFSNAFLMPFYLIQGRGLTSSHAGLLMTIQPLLMIVSAPLAGAVSDRIGTRLPAALGMAVLAAAMFMLANLGPATPLRYVVLSLAVAGLGIGMFVAPNTSSILGSAPAHRKGIASGVVATARYAGMILGVGIAGAIFTTFLGMQSPSAFFTGIQVSFLMACTVSCAGCVASIVRN